MSLDFSVGLGKTIFNSSITVMPWKSLEETEIILTERLNRIKNSGAWPISPLKAVQSTLQSKTFVVAENRDVQLPLEFEKYCDSRYPFTDLVKASHLERFSTLCRPILTLSHHEAHAWSSLAFSPFDSCLIMVLDGAGSAEDATSESKSYEYLSLFQWKNNELKLLEKKYLKFIPSQKIEQTFSEGIGIFYEKASEFIFNTKTEAGKVMGLAPFGKSMGIQKSYVKFLDSLDWTKQFRGKGKKVWESSPHLEFYKDLAATVQENFEYFLFTYFDSIKEKYPNEDNLILTGGCALNCTLNGKLTARKIFKKVFIPPNPGDEGISLGCAFSLYMDKHAKDWRPTAWSRLTSSRGLRASVPSQSSVENLFVGYEVQTHSQVMRVAAELLSQGEVIVFFQGRSEVGPRSLGNRSILASPKKENLKKYLNENIKFREDFRPYGCTVQWEKSHLYFEVEKGFENPFMSFAVPVRSDYKEILKDISHIDGTSRMQTLHREQNEMFYDLLGEVEKLTGLPILLNTSLNVMNEPIVETIEDAKRFMESSSLTTIVIGNTIIRKSETGT